MLLILLVPAIVTASWSLWIRRNTWGCTWERAATLTVILMIFGSIFISPTMPRSLAPVGDFFLVGAAAGVCYMVVPRALERNYARRFLVRWVDLPGCAGLLLTLLAFALGHGIDHRTPMFGHYFYNDWIRIYWVMLATTVTYLLCIAVRALLVLRHEQRHRGSANRYLVSSVAGIGSCVVGTIGTLMGNPVTPGSALATLLSLLWIGGFAYAAGYSWRRKTAPIRQFKKAVHT